MSDARADLRRFAELDYDGFRALARDPSLSPYEKIGFPDSYRDSYEEAILDDIRAKLPALDAREQLVIDIGCGCSGLPRLLIDHCAAHGHELLLVDSQEMLDLLPDTPRATKLAGRFPDTPAVRARGDGKAAAVIVYSVLHYVFEHGDLHGFCDAAVALLAPGGRLLIGDVPNASLRGRFFRSPEGVAFHQAFMGTLEQPVVRAPELTPGAIDDGVLVGLVVRYRLAGFEAYLVPQNPRLPMANRREDLLIVRH